MLQRLTALCWLTTITVLVSACASAAPESTDSTREMLSEQSAPGGGEGYVHTAAKSKFRLGAASAPLSELGFSKLVGDQGVFATVVDTGWAMGISNANARSVSRLSWTATTHNKAVQDYFVGAGLPVAQVGGVVAHADVHAAGTAGKDPKNFAADGYTSRISRVVAGFLVPDSFACATFNDEGDVIEESVYWPEIPAGVIQDAKSLLSLLSDPTQGAAYRSTLHIPSADQGQVVVRHSPGHPGTRFESIASYDILDRSGSMGITRHFNLAGVEVKMLDEASPPPTSRASPPQ
jgi:hypothetical protein